MCVDFSCKDKHIHEIISISNVTLSFKHKQCLKSFSAKEDLINNIRDGHNRCKKCKECDTEFNVPIENKKNIDIKS